MCVCVYYIYICTHGISIRFIQILYVHTVSFHNIIQYHCISKKMTSKACIGSPGSFAPNIALTVRLSEAVAKVISPLWLDMTSLCVKCKMASFTPLGDSGMVSSLILLIYRDLQSFGIYPYPLPPPPKKKLFYTNLRDQSTLHAKQFPKPVGRKPPTATHRGLVSWLRLVPSRSGIKENLMRKTWDSNGLGSSNNQWCY